MGGWLAEDVLLGDVDFLVDTMAVEHGRSQRQLLLFHPGRRPRILIGSLPRTPVPAAPQALGSWVQHEFLPSTRCPSGWRWLPGSVLSPSIGSSATHWKRSGAHWLAACQGTCSRNFEVGRQLAPASCCRRNRDRHAMLVDGP